ncbi:hypothetical protein EJ04DRAFT_605172 [Polyplosphaeria fusca]|uniref:Uncharacterized protein n=1 Tax=Polyplosphaeria fusca TaxID=682080 RepID=A0A9P4V0M6_9PLEO|nr:hypothetical protein EJ04DRAFT_605172 [Polyplosphaeria fusca]
MSYDFDFDDDFDEIYDDILSRVHNGTATYLDWRDLPDYLKTGLAEPEGYAEFAEFRKPTKLDRIATQQENHSDSDETDSTALSDPEPLSVNTSFSVLSLDEGIETENKGHSDHHDIAEEDGACLSHDDIHGPCVYGENCTTGRMNYGREHGLAWSMERRHHHKDYYERKSTSSFRVKKIRNAKVFDGIPFSSLNGRSKLSCVRNVDDPWPEEKNDEFDKEDLEAEQVNGEDEEETKTNAVSEVEYEADVTMNWGAYSDSETPCSAYEASTEPKQTTMYLIDYRCLCGYISFTSPEEFHDHRRGCFLHYAPPECNSCGLHLRGKEIDECLEHLHNCMPQRQLCEHCGFDFSFNHGDIPALYEHAVACKTRLPRTVDSPSSDEETAVLEESSATPLGQDEEYPVHDTDLASTDPPKDESGSVQDADLASMDVEDINPNKGEDCVQVSNDDDVDVADTSNLGTKEGEDASGDRVEEPKPCSTTVIFNPALVRSMLGMKSSDSIIPAPRLGVEKYQTYKAPQTSQSPAPVEPSMSVAGMIVQAALFFGSPLLRTYF